MGSWKKFIMGEKMPDKDDPQYKERYEKDVDAGRRFARWSGGFVILCFCMNVYRMGLVWSHSGERKSAVEQQDEMIKNRHRRVRKAVSSVHCVPPSINKDFQESVTKNNQDNGLSDTKED